MSNPSPADAELSPEARAIITRARRSFMISMGLLLAGFIVIGGVLVYRAVQSGETPGYTPAALAIPQGAEIVSATASGGEITVTYRLGPAVQIRVYDGKTGEVLTQFDVVGK